LPKIFLVQTSHNIPMISHIQNKKQEEQPYSLQNRSMKSPFERLNRKKTGNPFQQNKTTTFIEFISW
jgi:hypothetical protein